MIKALEQEWIQLASTLCEDKQLVNTLWAEIRKNYTSATRYYHNLSHIEHMLSLTETIKGNIKNLKAFKLAIWYHDIVYSATKKNNEALSAKIAQKRLQLFDVKDDFIKTVSELIMSTKKHQLIVTKNLDNAYLLDIDLSILGAPWETYKIYIANIRKEYKVYPNFMYNPGRKKVLRHFLERKTLFFTEPFKHQFELQARENLKKEIELL